MIAQSVEQRMIDPCVVGSIPTHAVPIARLSATSLTRQLHLKEGPICRESPVCADRGSGLERDKCF